MREKRWLCTILAAVFLFLAACGNSAATWQEQYDLGVKYLSEGNYGEAILAFTAAIEIDAKRPEGFIGRGDAYALSGDTEDNLSAALADYEAAIALDETMPGAWLGLADVYIRRGDYEKAMEVLREALEKTGSDQSIADKLAEMESGSFADSVGNVRRMNSYDGAGNLTWYHIYTYNSRGQKMSVSAYASDGTQTGYIEYSYNGSGDVVHGSDGYINDTGELRPTDYQRDENGELQEKILYALDGDMVSRTSYEWNAERTERKTTTFRADGSIEKSSVTVYDLTGNETEIRWYGSDGELTQQGLYSYDEQGRCTVLAWYDSTGMLQSRWEYVYDAEGNRTFLCYDAQGNLTQMTES